MQVRSLRENDQWHIHLSDQPHDEIRIFCVYPIRMKNTNYTPVNHRTEWPIFGSIS